jgi:hypothetical protein
VGLRKTAPRCPLEPVNATAIDTGRRCRVEQQETVTRAGAYLFGLL